MRFGNRRLRVYYDKAQQLLECFTDIKIAHVPRKENSIADADANLATALAVNGGQSITVKVEERCVIPNSYFEEDDEGKVTSDVAQKYLLMIGGYHSYSTCGMEGYLMIHKKRIGFWL